MVMKSLRQMLVLVILSFCGSIIAFAQISIDFGPEDFSNVIEGEKINFRGNGKATIFTPKDKQRMDIDIHLTINLSGLQKALPNIIQLKGNRNDTCGEVIKLHTIDLRSNANLFIAGHFEQWSCWYIFGKQIKNKLFEQNGDATLQLSFKIQPNGKGFSIETQVKDPHFDGLLGVMARNSMTGSYITQLLTSILQKSLDPSNLKQAFPTNLETYNPVLNSAKFVSLNSNELGVEATAHFSLSQGDAQILINNLRKKD